MRVGRQGNGGVARAPAHVVFGADVGLALDEAGHNVGVAVLRRKEQRAGPVLPHIADAFCQKRSTVESALSAFKHDCLQECMTAREGSVLPRFGFAGARGCSLARHGFGRESMPAMTTAPIGDALHQKRSTVESTLSAFKHNCLQECMTAREGRAFTALWNPRELSRFARQAILSPGDSVPAVLAAGCNQPRGREFNRDPGAATGQGRIQQARGNKDGGQRRRSRRRRSGTPRPRGGEAVAGSDAAASGRRFG